MSENKISIIVPVYNLDNYIEKTLDSICNQTYSNIEIVVVDDGSSDNSWNIVCNYSKKDKRVVAVHQENSGVTVARLNGVKNATGDWIGFVDGDDVIDEDMYELLIKNAIDYNADISHCGYRMVFEDGRINYFYNTGCLIEQDNLKGLTDLLDGSIIEPGLCNKLFKKTLFYDILYNDVIDKSIKNNEDLLINFILFSNSKKSVFFDKCKYQYVVRQGSASRSINEHTIYDPIKVKRIIREISPQEIKSQAMKAYLSTCINAYNVLVVGHANKKDKKKVLGFIKDQKNNIFLLAKKNQMLTRLLFFSPAIYNVVYKIYSKYFQKKKYD